MRYFADTSFWLALLSRRDAYHAAAVDWRRRIGISPIVTTDLVLCELLNVCAAGPLRLPASAMFSRCRSDSQIQLIWADQELVCRGATLYASRPDKEWGLVDCVSFTVMEGEGLQDALTSDHHFQQAGYRALLR